MVLSATNIYEDPNLFIYANIQDSSPFLAACVNVGRSENFIILLMAGALYIA